MVVVEFVTDVVKQRTRRRGNCSNKIRAGGGFENFVFVIRLHAGDDAASAGAPIDRQGHRSVAGAGGKNPEGFALRKVLASRDHLLGLDDGASGQRDTRTHSGAVTRLAFQSYRNPWRRRFVPIDQRGALQPVQDDVEIAVAIEIHGDHAVGHLGGVKSPGGAAFLKRQIVTIAKRNLRRLQGGVLMELILGGQYGAIRRRCRGGALGYVPIVDVMQMSIRDQQILPTIQIDIQKHGRPGPPRGGHAGEAGDLRPGAISAVPIQGVARHIFAVGEVPGNPLDRTGGAGGAQVPPEIPAQHFHGDEFQSAIPVDIRKIHAHRGVTQGRQNQGRSLAEMAAAIPQPQPVRRLKIVADIDIRSAVAIDVADLHRQPEVTGHFGRLPVGIGECFFPGQGSEVTVTVIQEYHVRIPQLHHHAIDDLDAIGVATGDVRMSVHHAGGDDAAVPQKRFDAKIAPIEVQIAIAVQVRQRQGSAAAFPTDPSGGGDIGEVPVPVVMQQSVGAAKAGDQQVGGAVAIDVGKDCADGGLVRAAGVRAQGDVFEVSIAEVPIKLIGPLFVAEIEIHEAVPIHVGGRQTGPVHQVLKLLYPDGIEGVSEIDAQLGGIQPGESGMAVCRNGEGCHSVSFCLLPDQRRCPRDNGI